MRTSWTVEEKVSDKVMSPLDIKVDTSAELTKKKSSSPRLYSLRSPSRIKRGMFVCLKLTELIFISHIQHLYR